MSSLWEIAVQFFKLGCIAFGGPAAHIAMMEQEFVARRKWIERQHFLDLIGATNLIPGPNSTEMTMHLGYERAGWKGLFVAGISFVFPAALLTGILAYFYVEYGHIPQVAPFIYGIKPAVLAIIASAIYKLGKKALKTWELGLLGTITLIISLLGINEVLALLATGILGMLYFFFKSKLYSNQPLVLFPIIFLQLPTLTVSAKSSITIFLTFLKVGAILYGSGYVLFAYLDAELVAKGWLSRAELIDAIAIGQFTPGPVLSTATFIGYQLHGVPGAIAATLGIFLPSFLFVWLLNPLIPTMQRSKILRYFLDSVNIAAVAVMIAVLLEMGLETLTSWKTITIALLSTVVVFQFRKIHSFYIILGGSIFGWALYYL